MPTLLDSVIDPPKIIKIEGTPYDMGKQHGKQLKPLIIELYKNAILRLENVRINPDLLDAIIERNILYFKKVASNRILELEGMAEGAGLKFEDLFLAHFCHEIECAQPRFPIMNKCTAFSATKNATTHNDTLISMNTDSGFNSMKFRIIIKAEPKNGYRYISHSRATDNGGYGINEKGIAIVAPTVRCKDSVEAFNKYKPSGLYDRAISRTVLEECANLEEAIDYIVTLPGGYQGLNIMIMDGKGEIANIEKSYNEMNVIYPNGKHNILAATNHYESKKMNNIGPIKNEGYVNSYIRYDRIVNLLTQNIGKLDVGLFKSFTRDHFNEPDSICRHGEKTCTNCSLITQSQPNLKRIFINWGTPCKNHFECYTI